jgi:hypothetical protein
LSGISEPRIEGGYALLDVQRYWGSDEGVIEEALLKTETSNSPGWNQPVKQDPSQLAVYLSAPTREIALHRQWCWTPWMVVKQVLLTKENTVPCSEDIT